MEKKISNLRKTVFLIFMMLTLTCLHVSAQRTYYYKTTKRIDKNGVLQPNKPAYYITFNDNVAYISDANGISQGGMTLKYRGRTSDGNLWYCAFMEQPQVSYLPGIGPQSYTTTNWQPDWGEIIVTPDYSSLQDKMCGYTNVMVRTTP